MSLLDLDGEDEIEEVCELLYDIAKSSENGISADELAVEYQRQFVESGIAKPLPLAWLEYVRLADEFAVTERNGAVIVGIVTKTENKLASHDENATPSAPTEDINLKPLPLSSMPSDKIKVYGLASTDPYNISIRLCSWDPMPDYLYSALAKDYDNESAPRGTVLPSKGVVCIVKLASGSWERVLLVRPSTLAEKLNFWVVYALDVGVYHIVQQKNLHPLSANLKAFDKLLLAKCQLADVRPAGGARTWSKNAQAATSSWLADAQGAPIEMCVRGEWRMSDGGPSSVPTATASLVFNGESLAQKLVSQGLAEKI